MKVFVSMNLLLNFFKYPIKFKDNVPKWRKSNQTRQTAKTLIRNHQIRNSINSTSLRTTESIIAKQYPANFRTTQWKFSYLHTTNFRSELNGSCTTKQRKFNANKFEPDRIKPKVMIRQCEPIYTVGIGTQGRWTLGTFVRVQHAINIKEIFLCVVFLSELRLIN